MKVGCTAWLTLGDGSRIAGVVKAVSPRRIKVWFGHTGLGQKVWSFTQHGWPTQSMPDYFVGKLDSYCGTVGECTHCGTQAPPVDRVEVHEHGTVTYYKESP